MLRNVVRGFDSVVFCTVAVPSDNIFYIAACADVLHDSFDYILLVGEFRIALALRGVTYYSRRRTHITGALKRSFVGVGPRG